MATPTTFSMPLRFRCPEGCGLCCSYRVAVLAGETEFLQTYAEAVLPLDRQSVIDVPNTGGYLKRVKGRCVFLDADRRCSIYEERPTYCRLYPLVRDSYPRRQVDINLSCRGVGTGEAITEEDIERVAEVEATFADLDAWEATQYRSYKYAVKTLRSRGAFVPHHVLVQAAQHLCRGAVLTGAARDAGERLHQLVESRRPALLSCGNVDRPAALVELFGGPHDGSGAHSVEEGRAELLDYLVLWTRRNLTLRAAHAQALASPLPLNAAFHFLTVIAMVAGEVCEVASRCPHEDRMQTAIRQVDASLRSRCMRAAILTAGPPTVRSALSSSRSRAPATGRPGSASASPGSAVPREARRASPHRMCAFARTLARA